MKSIAPASMTLNSNRRTVGVFNVSDPLLSIEIPSPILHDSSSSMSLARSPFGFSILSTSAGHIWQRCVKRPAPSSYELHRSPVPCSSCMSRRVLLSAKNSEISQLLHEVRDLKSIIQVKTDEEEDRRNIIPHGLVTAIQHLKSLPDVFSCLDSWYKYDDQKFLEHMESFGAGELVRTLQDIIIRATKLLHPHDPTPSISFLAPKLALMCSIIFDTTMCFFIV